MKHNFFILVLFVFLFLLVGVATLTGEFIAFAMIFLAAAFVSILTRPKAPEIQFERRFSHARIQQETPLDIELVATNHGDQLAQVSIEDHLPKGMQQIEGETRLLALLAPGESVVMKYTVQAHRGSYSSFETSLSHRQALNGFEYSEDRKDPTPLLVYPETEALSPVRINPPQTHGFAGSIASRRAGSGVDFLTIREYQPGDSLRQINWKVSARGRQTLYTNIFEQEQVANVGLILDARQRVNLTQGKESLFENSVKAIASLAERFLDDGHRVSLLVYGSGKRRVFPGYGRIQQRRILDAVASVTPVINFALTNFDNLPVQFFPPKSQIVLVSPIVKDDIPYIRKMRMYGYGVLVVSPDPVSFIADAYEDLHSPAYRMAIAERAFMIQQLRHIGAQVVDWNVHETLDGTLQRAVLPGQQRRGRIF